MRMRKNLLQHLECCGMQTGRKKRVLAAVAGDAKLGKAQHRHLAIAGFFDGSQDACFVGLPVQRGLVQRSGPYLDQFHE